MYRERSRLSCFLLSVNFGCVPCHLTLFVLPLRILLVCLPFLVTLELAGKDISRRQRKEIYLARSIYSIFYLKIRVFDLINTDFYNSLTQSLDR